MLKRYFLRPTLAVWIVSLFLVSLALTACGGAAESTSEAPVTPAATEETIAQATEEQKATATEKIATEEVAAEETEATKESVLPHHGPRLCPWNRGCSVCRSYSHLPQSPHHGDGSKGPLRRQSMMLSGASIHFIHIFPFSDNQPDEGCNSYQGR